MTAATMGMDASAPDVVVIRRARNATAESRHAFVHRLARLLPHLNWRSHIYVLPGHRPADCQAAIAVGEAAASFVAAHSVAALVVHPFVRLREAEDGDIESPAWRRLLATAAPFQEEAYRLQGEPRLMISPVLDPGADIYPRLWQRAATALRARSAHPSVFLASAMAAGSAGEEEEPPRFYIADRAGGGTPARIEALAAGHVVESAIARVAASRADLLAPCRPHLLIDEAADVVFACFERWKAGSSLCTTTDWQRAVEHGDGVPGDDHTCGACLSRSMLASSDNLSANRRQREGRRLHFDLALALTKREQYTAGAQHAERAADLADSDSERGSALLHQGLCHLSLGELEAAEAALARAAESADDPGIVAYHRGRNQLEWRDYIEALDRFEEARASGSAALPSTDLFFQMALCHVRLEEYAEARPHIERWREAGGAPAEVLFYRALCDLGEADLETALTAFRAALEAGPEPSDRGRVLFYIGHCLKELDRHDEAIEPLTRAVALEPGDLATHNLLGFCYYKTAQHERAVECFRRAIEIDPRSGIDHANLASNLRDLGHTGEAVAMYQKALELDPTIEFARDNLARLQNSAG